MDFMELALRLGKKANPYPNPRVGAVLVRDGKIIGKGHHRKPGLPHAEIEAIKDAKKRGNAVEGATLYVTLEPCSHINKRTPPCTDAIIKNKIGKVVFGMKDPNPFVRGAVVLKKHGIAVRGPVARKKAEKINREYLELVGKKPFVAIKMAMSADGKTATRTGDSKWISCPESREYVHRLRAEYDAVMVGAGTVKRDNPRLSARIMGARDPLRVIVDGRLSIPLTSRVVKKGTVIAVSEKAPKKKVVEAVKKGAGVLFVGKDSVDIKELVGSLGAMGVKKILIEGGSGLNASALEAGAVQRIYLFIAPKIIGGDDARGVIGGRGIETMKSALEAKKMTYQKSGRDILLILDL
jgi:diaminohydroxyphosphoribosylaminopyrimidine deaminase/5-amino-6-(5-phosphoribosylamino)uracil reductase